MGIRPRLAGATHARAHHSPAARTFLHRIAPFFAGSEIAGGPMLIAAVLTLAITNSAWGPAWERFWDTSFRMQFGAWHVVHPLGEWIDHALLPLFFVIIGTDVKRELTRGALADWRTAAFPVLGAAGGMLVPVALFMLIAGGTEGAAGWGTVITTDTAFGLALLAMFATRLPRNLRALLLAFAAIDDVGGLLVIAAAYSHELDVRGLVLAAVAFGAMMWLRRVRWASSVPYVLLAATVWAGILESGVHATIAGVLIGLVAPVSPRLGEDAFAERVQERVDKFQHAYREMQESDDVAAGEEREAEQEVQKQLGYLDEMTAATDVTGERLVAILNPWVSYVVLPLFVLSNVHIHLTPDLLAGAFSGALAPAIVVGLVLGKPLGFLGLSWLGTRLGIAVLPERVTWPLVGAIGALAGIGFTISLFIAGLAFTDARLIEEASLGVLAASLLSGGSGYAVLRRLAPRREEA